MAISEIFIAPIMKKWKKRVFSNHSYGLLLVQINQFHVPALTARDN
jgi:hypothetical protein